MAHDLTSDGYVGNSNTSVLSLILSLRQVSGFAVYFWAIPDRDRS